MSALRRPMVRWLVALLLLAAFAWGVGQLRSDRGAKPELGVGDLRPGEAAGDARPAAPAPGAAAASGPATEGDAVAPGER